GHRIRAFRRDRGRPDHRGRRRSRADPQSRAAGWAVVRPAGPAARLRRLRTRPRDPGRSARLTVMRIVISHHAFADFAGTESYIHTVAVALQRLGHDVTVYAERTGPMAEFARERGVRVVETTGALPD